MSKHLMARFRHLRVASSDLNWQESTDHFDFTPWVIGRSQKTGEPLRMLTARSELGDHLTVTNSYTYPGKYGYTIWSNPDLNNVTGIKTDEAGNLNLDFAKPMANVGHGTQDSTAPEHRGFDSAEEAVEAAEKHYYSFDHSRRQPEQSDSGVDYSDIGRYTGREELNDDFGDIFGGG